MSMRQKLAQLMRRKSTKIAEAEQVRVKLTDDMTADDARAIEVAHASVMREIEGINSERDAIFLEAIEGGGAAARAPAEAGSGLVTRDAHAPDVMLGREPKPLAVTPKEIRDLQSLAARNGVLDDCNRWIDEGHDRRAVSERMHEMLARRDDALGPHLSSVTVDLSEANTGRSRMSANTQTLDNPDFARKSMEDALYARMTGKVPEGAAREFVGKRLTEIDAILAGLRGERRGWLDERGGGMHTTSDFPQLLTGAGNRVLQEAYQGALSPLLMLARVRNSTDFRPINVLRLSEAPALEKIKESGEVHYGSRAEEKEAFQVETFAKIFSISRNAIINDDLGAFGDSNAAFGRGAAQSISASLVALFTANAGDGATLGDGGALFSTTRGNKAGAAAAITTGSLGGARQALRECKGLDGVTPAGMTPRFLVVGPAIETAAEQALAAIWAGQTTNANPFAGKLELLVEPRFTGNAWRVFADPTQQAVISVAYLNGQRGPLLEMRDGWTTLGVEFRAILDFGGGITDWRGAYLNAGA